VVIGLFVISELVIFFKKAVHRVLKIIDEHPPESPFPRRRHPFVGKEGVYYFYLRIELRFYKLNNYMFVADNKGYLSCLISQKMNMGNV